VLGLPHIEQMPGSKPTIKQKLAAIRMLYDFLVIRQLVPVNPTASVRGPKYVVKRGKTPVWSREDTIRSFWNRFRAMIWPGCAIAP
jgi:site-specific recombinase XerC